MELVSNAILISALFRIFYAQISPPVQPSVSFTPRFLLLSNLLVASTEMRVIQLRDADVLFLRQQRHPINELTCPVAHSSLDESSHQPFYPPITKRFTRLRRDAFASGHVIGRLESVPIGALPARNTGRRRSGRGGHFVCDPNAHSARGMYR